MCAVRNSVLETSEAISSFASMPGILTEETDLEREKKNTKKDEGVDPKMSRLEAAEV